jgi:biopolymer transport protein ExbD
MSSKKDRYKKKPRASDEMSLQITSMADIFTIILVFLLKSYATSAVNVTPSAGMKLPVAVAPEAQSEALKLEISATSIQVENKPIATLQNFRLPASDVQTNQTSKQVSDALETERKRQDMISKANPDVKPDSKILIIADEHTPYSTLKTVLASAAVNGFTDYKLVVAKKE